MSPTRRGRPSKFGRPSQVVALTLPEDVLRGLRKVHSDVGWAIVSLLEKSPARRIGRVRGAAGCRPGDDCRPPIADCGQSRGVQAAARREHRPAARRPRVSGAGRRTRHERSRGGRHRQPGRPRRRRARAESPAVAANAVAEVASRSDAEVPRRSRSSSSSGCPRNRAPTEITTRPSQPLLANGPVLAAQHWMTKLGSYFYVPRYSPDLACRHVRDPLRRIELAHFAVHDGAGDVRRQP